MSNLSDILRHAEQVQQRLLAHQPTQIRDQVRQLAMPGRACLLTGPRGIGKTTWMIRQCQDAHFLYLSVDQPTSSTVPLYDLIEAAFLDGYEGVMIDEVHYTADWARHLKAAYDSFPGKTIVASDSSTIVLREGVADLSRRFPVRTLPLVSFREYLMLKADRELPCFDPFAPDLPELRKLTRDLNVMRHFKEYLRVGFRPLFLESSELYLEKVMNTVAKAMEADIPFLVPQLTENHLRLMNAVIGYLAMAKVPRLEINSLCAEWSVGKDKLYSLLEAMQRAHLLRIVRKQNDTKLNSAGAKIFLHEPAVYTFYTEASGTVREAYVAAAFQEAGKEVFAATKEVESDFVIEGKRVEVGGGRKSRKQANLVIRDDMDMPAGQAVPLWLLGFQY